MGSRSKRKGKLQTVVELGDFPRLQSHYAEIPFVNENGDVQKRASGGIQMNYCPNCEALQPPAVAGYCGLCGKHGMIQKIITMGELKKNSRKKGIKWIKPKGYEE